MRSVRLCGQSVRLLGIEGYGSARGGDAIFLEVEQLRPRVVLMESYAVDAEVRPGAALPYRECLPARGLAVAQERVANQQLRDQCTAEVVAVLTALRVGAEVRLGDRLHSTSFDRLIDRRSLNDLRTNLVLAVEAIAGTLATNSGPGPGSSERKPRLSDLPQNFLCPLFSELGAERHRLMAQFVREAVREGGDIAVVVGAEHVDRIADRLGEDSWEEDTEGLLQGASLGEPPEAENRDAWEQELEKRVALAAFLASTMTFPPDAALPPYEQLLPEAQDFARKVYPKYRNAFRERLQGVLGQATQEQAFSQMSGAGRLVGLPQLAELCAQLAGVGGENFPPTPPPPPQCE